MKISKFIMAAILISGFWITSINAQITLQFGAGLGLVTAGSDYKGSAAGYYNGSNYGMDKGLNIHAKARAGLLSFVVAGEINYLMMSSDGAYNDAGQGNVDVSLNVFSLRVGPEIHFGLPLVPLDPYVGINVQVNTFSGDVNFQGVSGVPSGSTDIESATRYGVGLNGGVVFNLVGFKLDLNLSYNMLNLSGKEFKDAGDNRIDSYKNLNDDSDPNYSAGDTNHFISDSRAMDNMEVKVTVMFGL